MVPVLRKKEVSLVGNVWQREDLIVFGVRIGKGPPEEIGDFQFLSSLLQSLVAESCRRLSTRCFCAMFHKNTKLLVMICCIRREYLEVKINGGRRLLDRGSV
jgi:hypothetical protein